MAIDIRTSPVTVKPDGYSYGGFDFVYDAVYEMYKKLRTILESQNVTCFFGDTRYVNVEYVNIVRETLHMLQNDNAVSSHDVADLIAFYIMYPSSFFEFFKEKKNYYYGCDEIDDDECDDGYDDGYDS